MPTLITAGDATNGVVLTSSNDNAITIQTGAAGAKVNAIALASDGGATFIKTTGGILTLGTAQNTTSGTSIDFTGIPSWVKRVTVMFNGVSTSGTSNLELRIGAGSVDATGYSSTVANQSGTTAGSSTGFVIANTVTAVDTYAGAIVLTNITANTWTAAGVLANTQGSNTRTSGGAKSLSGALDRVRLTTAGGTDTFDAGSVNILYEG